MRAKRFKVRNQFAFIQKIHLRLKSRFHYAFKSPQMDRRSRCKNGPQIRKQTRSMISCLPSYKLLRREAIALTSSALVLVLVLK